MISNGFFTENFFILFFFQNQIKMSITRLTTGFFKEKANYFEKEPNSLGQKLISEVKVAKMFRKVLQSATLARV